jgi:outer membrane protein assembly factor BamE (lipoprotein component of BamABCDE complex)
MNYLKVFIVFLTFFVVQGCLRERPEGLILEKEKVEQVQLDQSITDVIALLGTPSLLLKGEDDDDILVYVASVKEWRAFLKPQTKSQTVLELYFTKGVLTKKDIKEKSDIDALSTYTRKDNNNKCIRSKSCADNME